jgi:hypothetical protein
MALTSTSLSALPLLARGKVRDIYSIPSSPSTLLFVATDRVSPIRSRSLIQISAYDVILNNVSPREILTPGNPTKGKDTNPAIKVLVRLVARNLSKSLHHRYNRRNAK